LRNGQDVLNNMENVELVTVSSETDSEVDQELDNDQEDFNPLIRGGDSAKTRAQIRRTRLVYDPSKTDLKSPRKCSWKQLCFCLMCLAIVCVTVFIFMTGEDEEPVSKSVAPSLDYMDFKQPKNMISYRDIMEDNFRFNLSSSTDVMVFLHIQKTGGTTFGKHLVQDIDLAKPCLCHRRRNRLNRRKLHCDCFRPGTKDSNWLFSRYSTGWKCGLHPDWTELTGCVDKYLVGLEGGLIDRRYFYITFLRDPVDRYLSEWRHVQRGATWKNAELRCGNQSWANILPKCYEDVSDDGFEEDWSGVPIQEFMACSDNLASNRQTRMLADLELVHCYNKTSMDPHRRDLIMLNSAKSNLERMAYFGMTEEQKISQYLFEETFNLEFKTSFQQYNKSDTHSGASKERLDESILEKIRTINHLDIELHKFAHKLLKDRFESMKETDESFQDHMQRLGKEKYEFSWDDIESENYDTNDTPV